MIREAGIAWVVAKPIGTAPVGDSTDAVYTVSMFDSTISVSQPRVRSSASGGRTVVMPIPIEEAAGRCERLLSIAGRDPECVPRDRGIAHVCLDP